MTAFDQGQVQALLESVRAVQASLAERKAVLQCSSPCGLTSLEYAELLGMALGGLEGVEAQVERMTQNT